MKDLVILVADKNMHFALRGALSRPVALGIRAAEFEFRVHPQRDGGVRSTGVVMLARERRLFNHALLVLDLEGSGAENQMTATELEEKLDGQLQSQWGSNAKSIVIAPELDIWLWGRDNALREELDWPLAGSIRDWLAARGFEFDADGKPNRPKAALDTLRPIHRQPRSSALYERITRRISLKHCRDPAFHRAAAVLRDWFPAHAADA